jgi:hypothetical protein
MNLRVLVVACALASGACRSVRSSEPGELSLRVAGFIKVSGIT